MDAESGVKQRMTATFFNKRGTSPIQGLTGCYRIPMVQVESPSEKESIRVQGFHEIFASPPPTPHSSTHQNFDPSHSPTSILQNFPMFFSKIVLLPGFSTHSDGDF